MCILIADLSNLPITSLPPRGIPQDNDNNAEDESDWLHRNQAYQMQQIAGRMRAVAMPLDHNNSQTIQQNAGPLTQASGVQIAHLSRTVNLRTPMSAVENGG